MPRSTLSTAAQFVAMGVTWGASFLFIKVALGGLSFAQVAWTRLLLGTLTLVVIVLVARIRLPRNPRLYLHFLVLGVTFCVIPHLLFSWAEQYVTSGLASIYNATTPIMTVIMAVLVFRVERVSAPQLLGVGLGILGVVLIIAPWQAQLGGDLLGQFACLGATLCYGFSGAYAKRFILPHGVSGVRYATLTIGSAGVVMAVLTPAIALTPVRLDGWVVGSLLALGILGTGLAYVWNGNVMAAWGPTATSTVTYLTPVVGVVLGVIVLHEAISWHEPLGAIVVIVGILLAQRGGAQRESPTPERARAPRRAAARPPV
ncbi:DMT family transporter [Galbitalea sp. SE-J8]|uniref:DMT family transporter n=1 Tax=Galbitalea sp. SE-J8 TaxID=3054952 RepID=UPI00259C9777|nr:DMT family transporter [Galbitalea sp. SE-J8]MDM4762256.1 DMT family transporter [Galbitalea sp. SE-J8]